jgi:septum formation protein
MNSTCYQDKIKKLQLQISGQLYPVFSDFCMFEPYFRIMIQLKYPLLLGSKSPRRRQLLLDMGIEFTLINCETDESFPETLKPVAAAEFLAEKKARACDKILTNEIVLTADTIVAIGDHMLGKPADLAEARAMLRELSGTVHSVITGICFQHNHKYHTSSDLTRVYFRELTAGEIDYYTSQFVPLDKAGAYGIQEWIGMIGIEKIEGSYFNVVGLPVSKVYSSLKKLDLISD